MRKLKQRTFRIAAAVIAGLVLLAQPASAAPRSGMVVAQASPGNVVTDKQKKNDKKAKKTPPPAGAKHKPPRKAVKRVPPPPGVKRTPPPKAVKRIPPPAATKRPPPPQAVKRIPPPAATKRAPPPQAAKRFPPPSGVKRTPPPKAVKRIPPPAATKRAPPPQAVKRFPPPSDTKRAPQFGRRQPDNKQKSLPPGQGVAPTTPPGPAATPANVRQLKDFRKQRREVRHGNRTVIYEPGRTIVREGGHIVIQRNASDRFRSRARRVHTERRGRNFVTTIQRPDGTIIINLTDPDGRLLRRSRRDRRGHEVVLIDNRHRGRHAAAAAVGAGIAALILNLPPPRVHIPRDRYIVEADRADRALIYQTLIAPPVEVIDRGYTLDEIRYNAALRDRMRRIDINTITFDTGSWYVRPDQAARLEIIADAILEALERNRNEVFMIEGYTDGVGNEVDNLSLSDRRAAAVAEVLTDEFGVPPENLTTQGYGEQFLKVPTLGPEELNRRVAVRRITPLLHGTIAGRR